VYDIVCGWGAFVVDRKVVNKADTCRIWMERATCRNHVAFPYCHLLGCAMNSLLVRVHLMLIHAAMHVLDLL